MPLRDFQSVGFTPETATRIRNSPVPGSGIGRSTSSSTDGSPSREYVIAFIVSFAALEDVVPRTRVDSQLS
jgi:hypothetical protein